MIILLLAGGILGRSAPPADRDLPGPEGKVRVLLSVDGSGHLCHAVRHGERARLEPAPAGPVVEGVDLGAGVELGAPAVREVSETFVRRGPKRTGVNRCRVYEVPVRAAGGVSWTFEVRVFDDGAAFRYRVPGAGPRRVGGESTAWQLPPGCTLWFQTNTVNYEGVYQSCPAEQVPREQEVRKARRPVHLGPPVTVAYPDGGYGLITEAGLFGYSGLTLRPAGGARFQAAFEDDPGGWTVEGTVQSPWRVILLSGDLNGLVTSDVIPALADPPDPALFPEGPEAPWIRPGKAPCTWMVFGNDGARWDRQRWFVDTAAAMGCEYLLVDAGWRTERWGWMKEGGDVWARAAELCRYAAERGVGIVLWHAFPEGRNDGPGLTTIEAREEFFRRCREAGVRGVKIDFFDSESRAVVEACEDLLRRAARHRLMVNFHGTHKPTGEDRTWPNEITREGIREQEYVLWGSLPLAHYGALPFTRMAAGHADFLPGFVQGRHLKNTTGVFQMASVVVFSSPFLCWPDHPQAYLDGPWLPFVRTVPTVWDETRVLPGSAIGEMVVMARRRDRAWYVAALNCRAEPRAVELDLSWIDREGMEWTVWRDAPGAPGAVRVESGLGAPEGGRVSAELKAGGGLLVRAAPPVRYSGWKP